MLKSVLKLFFTVFFRVKVIGIENYVKAGKRVLVVVNHLSFIDAIAIALYLPGKPMFVVNSFIADHWLFKRALSFVRYFALDPTNPMATKDVIHALQQDEICVIFPEGRITVTGSLMKIYEGPAMIADKSGAQILPIRIEGAQYSPFSRLKGKVRIRLFPKITIHILPPRFLNVEKDMMGRERRHVSGVKLYDIMSEMYFESSDYQKTLFHSIIDMMSIHGRGHYIMEDILRHPITYGQFVARSFILGKTFVRFTQKDEIVGLLLPNMISSVIAFFGLHAYGRVPSMLNFSVGAHNVALAVEVAKIKTVVTSRRFIITGELEPLIEALEAKGITIRYLEDLRDSISLLARMTGFVKSYVPLFFYKKQRRLDSKDAAVVLFTSGSEGVPKGVVLSHENIQANRFQLASRVDFGPTDIVFNALPIFHSFGLTGGTLLPLLAGIKTFFYPSPLHYRIIPELVYDRNATIMFGTDTFLAGYAKYAHPYDFYSIRYVFAGAEKLKEETRKIWSEKYGVRIFEGYGATETAPALSTNTPMHNKPTTVGRLLPSIDYRIEKVPGVEAGGRLFVKGPNVMKGYLLHDEPGVIVPPPDGWYDTGDIVDFDEEGFISIKGRAKRFSKIAGEMISLTAVEKFIADLWPQYQHAVVAVSDDKKGEALVLLTNYVGVNREEISLFAKKNGITELSVPRVVKYLEKMPILATGKVDYVALQKLVSL